MLTVGCQTASHDISGARFPGQQAETLRESLVARISSRCWNMVLHREFDEQRVLAV